MKKYKESFKVDDEIPSECPICGNEIDLISSVETDPYLDGYRSILYCNNGDCRYSKVLNYETQEDAEKDIDEFWI